MMLPYSLFVLAYICSCFGIVMYLIYRFLRYQKVSANLVVVASIILLPLCSLIVSGFLDDDIELNPFINSSTQLVGTYSGGGHSLTLNEDGTYLSTGLFPVSSGMWTLGSFTLNLSGTDITPRVVACNDELCIAPYCGDVDAPVGLLLKRVTGDTDH